MTTTRTIDATGTWCPVPVGLLRRAAATADDGDIIEVLADDPLAAVDIPAWCHSARPFRRLTVHRPPRSRWWARRCIPTPLR